MRTEKIPGCEDKMFLTQPLTEKEIQEQMDENGIISGIVRIELSEFMRLDEDEIFNLMCQRLVENDILCNIGYKIEYCDKENMTLYIKVSGSTELYNFDEDDTDGVQVYCNVDCKYKTDDGRCAMDTITIDENQMCTNHPGYGY